jgi:hypothetical protein
MDGYNYYLLDRKTGFSSSDHLFFFIAEKCGSMEVSIEAIGRGEFKQISQV